MAPLIDRLARRVIPRPAVGTCLVCRDAVRDRDGALRLSGGGYVHHDCATYRMRKRVGRTVRAASPDGHEKFTGE